MDEGQTTTSPTQIICFTVVIVAVLATIAVLAWPAHVLAPDVVGNLLMVILAGIGIGGTGYAIHTAGTKAVLRANAQAHAAQQALLTASPERARRS